MDKQRDRCINREIGGYYSYSLVGRYEKQVYRQRDRGIAREIDRSIA